jgi:hypothetical protein
VELNIRNPSNRRMDFFEENPSLSPQHTRGTDKVGNIHKDLTSENLGKNRRTWSGDQTMKDDYGIFLHDGSFDRVRVFLQIFSLASCVISIAQFGVGSVASTYLVNSKNGAWWATLAVFFAGVCGMVGRNKKWVKGVCLFSSTGFIIALIATINDSMSAKVISSLSSCGSVSSGNTVDGGDYKSYLAKMVSYGKAADVENIAYCMATVNMLNDFEYDTCYCVTSSGGFCGNYILNMKSLYKSQNCGNILTTYAKTMEASQSFCALSTFAALVLFIFSCYILFPRHPSESLNISPIETQKSSTIAGKQSHNNYVEDVGTNHETDDLMLRS